MQVSLIEAATNLNNLVEAAINGEAVSHIVKCQQSPCHKTHPHRIIET